MARAHLYSVGVEEEYFIFDRATGQAVSHGSAEFIARAVLCLGDRVMPEMLQSQIEVATPPCRSAGEIRCHLAHFRTTLSAEATPYGFDIAALGTFPLTYWRGQTPTAKPRYRALIDGLQMLGLRNMLCGMHVHVEVPEPGRRMPVIQRIVPHLPLLLALSASSPFWEGHPTGLRGYRLAAYDELPRTGLPELLRTDAEYSEYVNALVDAGVIEDASHIWWAIRPSAKHPTIELRVADSCTRLEDGVAISTLFRAMVRAFDRNPDLGAPLDRVGRAITAENKWRAQRYGVQASLVDLPSRRAMTTREWLDRLVDLIGGGEEVGPAHAHLCGVIASGTSADEQIRIFETARAEGCSDHLALRAVIEWAARETAGQRLPLGCRPTYNG
jgi:carboxylate-amine ligase